MKNQRKRRFFAVLIMCIFMFTLGTICSATADEDAAVLTIGAEESSVVTVGETEYDLADGDDFISSSNKPSTEWMKYIIDLNPLRGDNSKAIVGRQKEMSRLGQILCRCDKNNALIVGESGVGKSAIVKGMRSPSLVALTMTNCPGCADLATLGAWMSIR